MPKRIDNRFVPRYTLFCLAFLLVAWNIISNHRGKNIDLKRTGSCSVPLAAEAATSFHASLRANLTFIKATRHADMRSFNFLILILCGDIEVNPGPRAPKYPCGICCKAVKNSDMAVCCDDCDSWIHNRCSGVSAETYKRLEGNACSWICPKCSLPTFSDSFFFQDDTFTTFNSFSILSDNTDTSQQAPNTLTHHNSSSFRVTKTINRNKSGLKVLCFNANGISAKRTDLELLINDEKPSIICCQETHLDDGISSSEVFPPGFTVFRKDRGSRGGGVCIAVRDDLVASHCPELETDTESIWVKLQIVGRKTVYLCSTYRPPNSPSDYVDNLRKALDLIISRYHCRDLPHIVVAGDLNFPLINWKNITPVPTCQGNSLIQLAADFSLKQLVKSPTRIDSRTNAANILDLIFSSHPRHIDNLLVGDTFSDHAVISFNLIVNPMCVDRGSPRKLYLFNKGDYNAMRSAMQTYVDCLFTEGNIHTMSVDEIWQNFKHKLISLSDRFVPTKLVNNKYKPTWLNSKIKKLIAKRNKLAKRSLITGSSSDRAIFNKMRRTVKKEVKCAQRCHLRDVIGNIKESPSRFYKYINSKRTDGNQIPALIANNVSLITNNEKAEALSSQFSSVFTAENNHNIPSFNVNCPSMPNITITSSGVLKLLTEVKTNKSTGPDELAPRLLKECAREITPLITLLFNKSLSSSHVPADWKIANICPVFKKGCRNLPENYRPVSLTSVVSKLLEHIIFSNVSSHLEKHSILSPRQHGFRSGHSCESQLILALDDWSRIVDNKGQVDVAILDFSKAFDTVPHERLRVKLQGYGIRGNTLAWISTFLSGRRQRVALNGTYSNWAPVSSGVPQGTVLGPLLFLLYINDIGENIGSEIRLFADDCILYKKIASDLDCTALQTDLNILSTWAIKWQMSFNVKKCHIMHITKKRNPNCRVYNMSGTQLLTVTSYPYLGVEIQNNLSWENHVSAISKRGSKILGLLRRNINSCNRETKSIAYMSLVRPILEYASPVWDPYRLKHINSLDQVQRRAARFAFADYRSTSSVSAMLNMLKWPSLQDRRSINRLVLFYKAFNKFTAIPLDHLAHPTRITRRCSDIAKTFLHPHANSDIYKYAFLPRTIVEWNSLPNLVRDKPSIESFRSAVILELYSG